MGAIEISKKDWKLFRERIGSWQERYMEKLLKDYVSYLESDEPASVKFWELDERILADKRQPGISLTLEKKNVDLDLARLLHDGVIDLGDLDGFSEELVERVTELIRVFSYE